MRSKLAHVSRIPNAAAKFKRAVQKTRGLARVAGAMVRNRVGN